MGYNLLLRYGMPRNAMSDPRLTCSQKGLFSSRKGIAMSHLQRCACFIFSAWLSGTVQIRESG